MLYMLPLFVGVVNTSNSGHFCPEMPNVSFDRKIIFAIICYSQIQSRGIHIKGE